MRYPLHLTLRPSRRAQALIAAIHSVAAIAFLASSLDRGIVTGALVVLGVSLWRGLHAERAKAGRTLVLGETGLLVFPGAHGVEGFARPLPGCADFGWSVWLQWRGLEGPLARGAIVLMPDSVPPDAWRAMRAWLRHKAAVTPRPADTAGVDV